MTPSFGDGMNEGRVTLIIVKSSYVNSRQVYGAGAMGQVVLSHVVGIHDRGKDVCDTYIRQPYSVAHIKHHYARK